MVEQAKGTPMVRTSAVATERELSFAGSKWLSITLPAAMA